MAGHDSLDSSWVDVSGETIGTKGLRHSGGSSVEGQADQGSTTTLEYKLTQFLLDQVKAGKNNANANSGKQAYQDLPRMNFAINGQAIDKEFVSQQCNAHSEGVKDNNYRQTAKQVFTEMFKHAKAEVPNDHILEELITSCNQAGYEFAMYGQIQPILAQYNLIPTIPEKTMGIHCNSANSVSVEYSEVIVVKNPDSEQLEEYKCDSKLRFMLKSQDGKVEYENGKVTFTVPQELNNYKTDGKSLLGDIKECFADADNAVIESLTANIGEGPKSFVAENPSIAIEGNVASARVLDGTESSETTDGKATDPGFISRTIDGLVGATELAVDIVKEVFLPQDQNNVKPSCDEEEFSIIERYALNKVVNTLNKAINENDYEELDKVISGDIQKDENNTFIIDLSREKLEDFCLQQLNLTAQTDHHEHVRKMLIDEICNKENGNCAYSIKKLALLAIAANDMLAEKYKDILFTQDEDLDRLLIGAGGQLYVEFLLEFLEEKQSRVLPWNNICQKLKRASFVGNQECVEAILKKFGGVELKSEAGVSSKLLHYAIEQGENDVADILLSCKELDINSTDDNGYTPLHWAITRADLERAKSVLNNGVNVDIKCRRAGKTALHWAALHGCLEKVKLLVKKGADWNIVDSDGKTALDLASKNDKSEVVGFLKDLDGRTPLYYAVLKNRPDVVEKLVLEGAEINGIVRLRVGYSFVEHTPVTRAILDHQLELVKRLLTSKTDVNTGILGCYGVYYLSLAVEESKKFKDGVQWEIVNLILEHAPDISTPELKKAVSMQDYVEVVRLLQGIKSNFHDSNLVNEKSVTQNGSNKESLLDTENIEDDPTLKSNSSIQDTQPKTSATGSEPSSTCVANVPSVDSNHLSSPVPSVANESSDLDAVNNYTTASYHEPTNGSGSSNDEFFDAEEDDSENKSVDPIDGIQQVLQPGSSVLSLDASKEELVAIVENGENNNSRLAGEGDLQGLLPSFLPVYSPTPPSSPLMSDDECSETSSIDSNCTVIENDIPNEEEPLLSTQDTQTKTSATGSDGQSDENQQMNAEKAGSSNTPGIPEQILVPSNEKELVASTGYGMGDVITKTGNAGDLCVATLGTQQVVPHGGAKIFNKFYEKNATGLSIEFIAGNISEIVQKFLNAGISQVAVSTSTGSSVSLDFNDISKASQGGLQKIAKALMDLFTRGESNSRTVNAITNFSTVKTPALEQENNTHGNDQQPSDSVSNIQSDDVEVVSTTTNDQSTSIISSDGEDKQPPVKQVIPIVPKESEELAAQTAQDTSVRDGVTKNDNVVASVSSNDNHSDSSKIQLDESRTGSDQVSNQSTGHITKMDNERAPLSEGNSKLESNQQDLQPEVLPIVLNGNPNNIAVTNGNIKMPILEQKSDIKTNGKQSTNPNNGGVTAPSVQLAAPKSVDKNSGKKDTQPKPTGIPLVASKDSNRVSNAQGNSKQPSYPGKNNPAPQNAKSKLPVIAASMLAITGVATGIAIAVYLEMLMVGIAVGACCLVAAAIIYYCNKPLNSLEGSSVDKFTDGAYYTTVN